MSSHECSCGSPSTFSSPVYDKNGALFEEEEEIDPRIQIELEKLNTTTDDINLLETQLDEANATFRTMLSDSTQQLKAMSRKLGSCIDRARPYFEALEAAKKAQLDCQDSAVQYQKAYGIHKAAKETIALAEQRFMSQQHEWKFDHAWQEMLNHATIKVMEAEALKASTEREHQRKAAIFTSAEKKVQDLEKDLKRVIAKSRPYFEQKDLFNKSLMQQKEKIQQLQSGVSAAKRNYSDSLRKLEAISEEIHEKRAAHRPREPGVGAERDYQSLDFDLDQCDISSVLSEDSQSVTSSLGTPRKYRDREDLIHATQQLSLHTPRQENIV